MLHFAREACLIALRQVKEKAAVQDRGRKVGHTPFQRERREREE
jgi:hypothetical protein